MAKSVVRIGLTSVAVAQIPDDVLYEERRIGVELRSSGVLDRMWRLLGMTDHLALLSTCDASTLHKVLRSLPPAQRTTLQVQPSATHPPEYKTTSGAEA